MFYEFFFISNSDYLESVHNVRFTHKYIIFKGIREFVSLGSSLCLF